MVPLLKTKFEHTIYKHPYLLAWMYTAMAGAAVFIVIQLLLLVFCFHSWTDKLTSKVVNGGSSLCWYGGWCLTQYSCCAVYIQENTFYYAHIIH